jgi:AraC-like DNA-binding protein
MRTATKGINKLVVRYTIACLSVAFAAILFLLPVWFIAYNNTQELFIQDSTQQLNLVLHNLTVDIEYMQSSPIDRMKKDDIFLRIATGELSTTTPFHLRKLQINYENSYLPNVIRDMAVLFTRSDVVMLHGGMYSLSRHSDVNFLSFNGMNSEDFRSYIFSDEAKLNRFETGSVGFAAENDIPCILYTSYSPTSSAAFCVFLDAQKVAESLSLPQIGDGCFFYLQDKSGNMLLAHNYDGEPISSPVTGGKVKLEDGQYTLITLNDGYFDLVTGIPRAVFNENVRPLLQQCLAYLGGALAIALALSVGYAYFSVSPLSKMLKRINAMSGTLPESSENRPDEKNLYLYMHSALDAASKRYSAIEDENVQLRRRSESDLFRQLLHGVYRGGLSPAFTGKLQQIFVDYILLIVQIEGLPQRGQEESIRLTFADMVSGRFNSSFVHHGGYLSIVFSVPDCGGADVIAEGTGKIRDVIRSHNPGLIMRFGFSNGFSGASSLSAAFNQAGFCIQHLLEDPGGAETAFYSELSAKSEWFDFSVFEQYYNMLLTGDDAKVNKLYSTVLKKRVNPVVNTPMQESMFRMLSSIHISILQKLPKGEDIDYKEYHSEVNPLCLMRSFQNTAIEICALVNAGKRSHNIRLKNEIVRFIEESYADSNLNLTMIGDRFNISQRYASQFIKEQTGKNYTTLVESMRLGKAQDLLREESEMTIAQIAQLVGFESSNTFYKAFRRRYNVSPLVYRSMQQDVPPDISKDA